MASPHGDASATTNGTGATANPAVNIPTGWGANKLMIAIFRSAVAGAVSWPSGWTEIAESTADASDDVMAIGYHWTDGTEGSTIALTSGNGKFAAISYVISGAANPATQAPELSTVAQATGTTPNPTVVNPTGGTKDYLFLWAGSWSGEQTSPPASQPTNYSFPTGADSGVAGATATNCRVATAEREVTASSEDPGSWTISASGPWMAYVIAVHPGVTVHSIASDNPLGLTIDTAIKRETFVSVPDDLGLSIVTALSRQTFIASDAPLGPTIDTSLSPVIKVLAADMALGMVIDTALSRQTFISAAQDHGPSIATALSRETFIAAAEAYGPSIVTALSRETFISLAETLGLTIDVNLTVTGGGVEHFIAADMPLALDVATALSRETFIASAVPLGLEFTVGLTRETFIASDTNLAMEIATRLVMEMLARVDMPLGSEIYVNLTIEGQQVARTRLLLGAGQ